MLHTHFEFLGKYSTPNTYNWQTLSTSSYSVPIVHLINLVISLIVILSPLKSEQHNHTHKHQIQPLPLLHSNPSSYIHHPHQRGQDTVIYEKIVHMNHIAEAFVAVMDCRYLKTSPTPNTTWTVSL